jgi:hypothetical protein
MPVASPGLRAPPCGPNGVADSLDEAKAVVAEFILHFTAVFPTLQNASILTLM